MKKMNRRDYLAGMGVAAGAIATTAGLDVFAQAHRERIESISETNQPQGTQNPKPKRAERSNNLPPDQSVKLIFHGLMSLSHNGGTECEVAFHTKESDKHKHALTISVFRMPGCVSLNPATFPDGIPVPPATALTLVIDRPDKINGTRFYQPRPVGGSLHPNDFRWVIDLEGPNFYDVLLTKKPMVYTTKLVVKNGLFYTLQKTNSTFRRQTSDGHKDYVLNVGNVAEIIAANVYLKPGGSVHLTIGAMAPILLPQATGISYEVHFRNDCLNKQTNALCEFRPYHLQDKTERNDFYMHQFGIDVPREYELVLVQGAEPTEAVICHTPRLTDESPCAGVGFGGQDGFPPFPVV